MTCKLIHGDCLTEMDKLIGGGQKVDLMLIDPPYNINKDKLWDNRKKDEYIEFMGEIFTKALTGKTFGIYWSSKNSFKEGFLNE